MAIDAFQAERCRHGKICHILHTQNKICTYVWLRLLPFILNKQTILEAGTTAKEKPCVYSWVQLGPLPHLLPQARHPKEGGLCQVGPQGPSQPIAFRPVSIKP